MSEVETTIKQYNKIKRAVKALNDVRKEIQEENPEFEIQWYVENDGNLNLMSGRTHNLKTGRENFNSVVDTFYIEYCDVGGW